VIGRVLALVRFELAKLLSRRFTWIGIVLVLAAAGLAPFLGSVAAKAEALSRGRSGHADEFQNAWTALASGLYYGVSVLTFVLLILAGSSVAEEAQQGTLKTLFLRPVRRVEVLLAKKLALSVFACALVFLMTGVAAAVGARSGAALVAKRQARVDEAKIALTQAPDEDARNDARTELADAEREVERRGTDWYPDVSPEKTARVMLEYSVVAVFLTLPGLFALVGLGLLVSAAIDHPGHGTGVTFGIWFLLSALSSIFDKAAWSPWVFVRYVSFPFERLEWIGEAIGSASKELRAAAPQTVGVPLASAAVFFIGAALLLRVRDLSD